MAQTVSEATALNQLVRYISGDDPHGAGRPERESVLDGLRVLLKGSDRTLKAGYKSDDAERLLDLVDARLDVKEPAPAKAVKRKFGYTDADMREAEDWAAQHCDGDEVMHVVELPPFQYTTPSTTSSSRRRSSRSSVASAARTRRATARHPVTPAPPQEAIAHRAVALFVCP